MQRNKITMLSRLSASYEASYEASRKMHSQQANSQKSDSKTKGKFTIDEARLKNEILDGVIAAVKNSAKDINWYEKIASSFRFAIQQGQQPRAWLANQLGSFGIYEASSAFQNNNVNYHCMSFVCDFLEASKDDDAYDFDKDLDKRVFSFFPNLSPISPKSLQVGDVILYGASSKIEHIALYVATIDNTIYTIAKLGRGQNVFILPINAVNEKYLSIGAYATHRELKPSVLEKFNQVEKELQSRLSCLLYDYRKNKPINNSVPSYSEHKSVLFLPVTESDWKQMELDFERQKIEIPLSLTFKK